MKRFSPLWLVILAATFPAIPATGNATPRAEPNTPPQLTIRIYDYAGVSEKTLARAFHEAEKIYRKAGIAVPVVLCRPIPVDPSVDPHCGTPAGPTVIQVRLVPEQMAVRIHMDKRVFGFAATASRPQYGVVANVYYDRVKRLASEWDYRGYLEGIILGHVVAHEVGHLLLSAGSHSRRGIMHIPWTEPELALAHTGGLVFTREQSSSIRSDVAGRVGAANANHRPPGPTVKRQPLVAARSGL